MTYDIDVTIPLMKDVQSQAPTAICQLRPTGVYSNLLVNRDAAPFNDPKLRRAMALAIDRKSFDDILGQGKLGSAARCSLCPRGSGACRADVLNSLPGYSDDIEKRLAEAQAIMRELGYGPDKPLRVKVSTRDIGDYRDPAVILIDHLKKIYVEGELEVVDTTLWHRKVTRGDYSVGMNLTGIGVDDPDVNLGENYTCHSERNYNHYCNPEVEQSYRRPIQRARYRQAKTGRLADRAQACGRCRAARHSLPARSNLLVPPRQGARAASEQHLQRCAIRRRLARQVMGSYLIRRLLLMVVTLFGISVIIFVLLRIVPGNIADILFDAAGMVSAAEKHKLEVELGLDQPIVIQYIHWIGNLARGDFGYTYISEQPALQEILPRIPVTAKLAGLALLFSILFGVPLGILSAVRQNTALDYVLRVASLSGLSLPSFWLGLLILTGFVQYLGWIPIYTDKPASLLR